MRRISLALALVVSVCIATATTHAATTQSLHHSGIAGLLKRANGLSHVPRSTHSTLRKGAEPQAIAHSRSQQTAQTLALPQSAFSPAVLNSQYNYSETASFADTNWFASNHTPNSAGIYEAFGMQTGWYQRADWSGTNPATFFRYQGAKMSSATGAKNAWSDGIAYSSSQAPSSTVEQCSNNTSVLSCEYLDYTYTDSTTSTPVTERYMALQTGACLAEMTGTIPTANLSASSSTLVQTMNNMAAAAVTAMSNACGSGSTGGNPTPVPTATPQPTTPAGQTQFNVVSVRFEKVGSGDDFDLKHNPLTQVKAGTTVQLSMYVHVSSLAEASTVATREYQLKRNGKKVFDDTYNDAKNGAIDGSDTYHFYLPKVKLSKAGTYTFTAGVQIDGKVDAAQAKLKALKKYIPPKPVKFSLTNVSLSSSTIHSGQQAKVNVAFAVQNLKGHTTGIISRTVLANIKGQWKGVSTNSSTTLVVNGQNTQSVTTQFNAPGHFEIQITVTLGASTQSKTVPVTVE